MLNLFNYALFLFFLGYAEILIGPYSDPIWILLGFFCARTIFKKGHWSFSIAGLFILLIEASYSLPIASFFFALSTLPTNKVREGQAPLIGFSSGFIIHWISLQIGSTDLQAFYCSAVYLALIYLSSLLFKSKIKLSLSINLVLYTAAILLLSIGIELTTLLWILLAVISLLMIGFAPMSLGVPLGMLTSHLTLDFELPLSMIILTTLSLFACKELIKLGQNKLSSIGLGLGPIALVLLAALTGENPDRIIPLKFKPIEINLALNTSDLSNNVKGDPILEMILPNQSFYSKGRGADSEAETVEILGLLSPESKNILLLQDLFGTASSSLPNGVWADLIHPLPKLLRKSSLLSQAQSKLWKTPRLQFRAPLKWRRPFKYDAGIEFFYTEHRSDLNPAVTALHLKQVKNNLKTDGLYIAHLHLYDWPTPQKAINKIQKSFKYSQIWISTHSFEDLIVVGSDHPFSLESFIAECKKNNLKNPYKRASYAISSETMEYTAPSFLSSLSVAPQKNNVSFMLDALDPINSIWTDAEDKERIEPHRASLVAELKAMKALQQGEIMKAVQEAALSNSSISSPLVDTHIKNAVTELRYARSEGFNSPHYNEAIRHAQTALMLTPDSKEPLLILAEISMGQGMIDKALERYERVLEIDPVDISSLDGLARIYGLKGLPDKTIYYLSKAIQLAPQDWRRHHNLGYFLLTQGDFDLAEDHLRKALLLSSNAIEPQLALAELYLERGEYPRALLEIERTLETDSSANSWFLRGRAHFELKQYNQAEEDFRRATLADPQHHRARGAIGNCKIALGDLEGAAQAYRSALRFDPNNKVAKMNLIQVEKELANQTP